MGTLLQLTPEQITEKKEIGTLKSNKVFHMMTSGGLSMVIVGSAVPEILAVAPHRYMCKWMAKKKAPDIEFNELEKSEFVDPQHFSHLVEKYEVLTGRLSKLFNK